MNIPVIPPKSGIVPAKPTDRIRDRKGAGERRRRSSEEHEKERNKRTDDGRPHLDEYA